MHRVQVIITYGSEEPHGFDPLFKFKKMFHLKSLPCIPARIKLMDDAYGEIFFNQPDYDPDSEIYIVYERTSRKLQRYYHGNRLEIANEVLTEFRNAGWSIKDVRSKRG